MKKLLPLLLLICYSASAQFTKRPVQVRPKPVPTTTPAPVQVADTFRTTVVIYDTVHPSTTTEISVQSFGAVCDGKHDDILAWEAARDYVIEHPAILLMPVGNSWISRPFLLQKVVNGANVFFTIHIKGVLSNKSSSNNYLSRITCGYKSGYGIGIQLGRGIVIENITVMGQYSFPYSITNANIGTLKFSDWVDPTITDSRYSPYAGISIDPNQNLQGGQGGTSDVVIKNCAVKQWMVGIALTPNSQTLNDEMVTIADCDVEAVRVAIAIGQDQSKEIHIDRLKVWGSTHTIIDGVTYGRGTGGGSVDMYGGNIAGNVHQVLNISTSRFNFTSYGIHAESLFRIGVVGNGAGATFVVPQIDFLTGPGLPAADFLVLGQVNFYGGCLRYYNDQPTQRLNLAGIDGIFRDMGLSTPPLCYSLQGYPNASWDYPRFDNIHLYYNQGKKNLQTDFETLIKFDRAVGMVIDRTNWTGSFAPTAIDYAQIQVGDYILAAPASDSKHYYDQVLNPGIAPTLQVGRVVKKENGTVFTDDVGLNVFSTSGVDGLYISRVKP